MIEAKEPGTAHDSATDGTPQVEDTGRWFSVAMTVLTILFIAGLAAVVHSLVATFR